ncbi:protein TPX2-like isoform X2 [Prosopis cineraria]|uniref:protein TPX2-like isoform X2 n=1 Tax=Prosopis cineraria TaxID=364024 RepID=UPI00240F06E3|nr:protein TPX2-like isoform X2 [Prosopis cineraria]
MEEEFQEFVVESFLDDEEALDPDYEFDAPRFCDFSQPERFLDAVEAEQWFESAGSYPPSPYVLKLRLGKGTMCTPADWGNGKSSSTISDNSGHCMEHDVSAIEGDDRGLECHNHALKGKTKSHFKSSRSKISTLMKPTASHLAKQRNPSEVLTTLRISRSPSQSSTDIKETKRQKLEAGYLRKIAHLKHQPPFIHKKPQVDAADVNSSSKPRVTIPKQFNLETTRRAQKHQSRTNKESGECRKSSSHMFKALQLNKKILEGPSLSFCKKRTPQLTEFNVFYLKTSERAMQHTSTNVVHNSNCSLSSSRETRDLRRQNSNDESRQERCKPVSKLRGSPEKLRSKGERGVFRNIKQENEINDKRLANEPPSELFSKLSLGSEVKQTTTKKQPTSKGLKENRPSYFHLQNERMSNIKEEKHMPCMKQYLQCMNERAEINQARMLAGGCTYV